MPHIQLLRQPASLSECSMNLQGLQLWLHPVKSNPSVTKYQSACCIQLLHEPASLSECCMGHRSMTYYDRSQCNPMCMLSRREDSQLIEDLLLKVFRTRVPVNVIPCARFPEATIVS
ncbi:hypothetical protein CBR_g16995 [Chara braunii]|uniref:Uncharacterized protein n=1 Tax=Chara braunii TaxID=69332 RepID=A0A388KUI6_CHABU|nr:hypothetical protein CBR_g16995 [Chara braunii]|eukprot:GBG73652.1 hypothetical protein CBR_g16995 [Chara braunii]